MIFQRLRNLWYLSGLPKDSKGYPDEFERGHQAGEIHALGLSSVKSAGIVIPYKPRDPVAEIVAQLSDNRKDL